MRRLLPFALLFLAGCAIRNPPCPPPSPPPYVLAPSQPHALVTASATAWTANISWMDVNFFEDGNKIDRSQDDGVTWTLIGTTGPDTQLFIDPGPLTLTSSYCWRVTVYNLFSTATSPKVCAQVLPPALVPPESLNVTIVPPS